MQGNAEATLPDKGNLSLSLHNYLLPLNNIHLARYCSKDNLLILTGFSLVFRTIFHEFLVLLNTPPVILSFQKSQQQTTANSHQAVMCV